MDSAKWSKRISQHYAYQDGSVLFPIDISDVVGTYYIYGFANNGNSGGYVTCSKMFLSKDKITPLLPKSTTVTFPGGSISVSSTYSTYSPAALLHNQDTLWLGGTGTTTASCWTSNSATDQWIKVTFDVAKKVNIARIDFQYSIFCTTTVIQGSNDDTNWTDLCTITCTVTNTVGCKVFKNNTSYKYYRYKFSGSYYASYMGATCIQLYEYDNVEQVYKDLN